MEFVNAEQFLKLDKEVQKVFIDWWKVEIGDLFKYNYGYSNIETINLKSIKEDVEESKYSAHIIPLLTLEQLVKFVEDITGYRMLPDYNDHEGYSVWLYCKEGELKNKYRRLGKDLLQAYWEVATKVAKESINKKGR